MSPSPASPPPLPQEIVARVIRQGHTSGRMVLWLAGLYAVLCAGSHDVIGAIAGCAAAGAGGIALHGVNRLHGGNPDGLEWLTRSQLLFLATILIFCATRIMTVSVDEYAQQMTPALREKLATTPYSERQFLELTVQLTRFGYIMLGLVASLRFVWRIRFYLRARPAVELVLNRDA